MKKMLHPLPFVVIAIVGAWLFGTQITIPLYKKLFPKEETFFNSDLTFTTEQPTRRETYTLSRPRKHYKPVTDTISTYGSNYTLYLYVGNKPISGTIEVKIIADSLNGCTNARIYPETSDLGLVWVDDRYDFEKSNSEVINGSTTQEYGFRDWISYPTRYRFKIVAPTSTQRTKISFDYAVKQ
jgi:hypothetical protein